MPSKLCECSEIRYRNNHDGTRDYIIQGKTGCPKCHRTGLVDDCSTCAGCGMLPGSKICPGCTGHGVVMALPKTWAKTKSKLPA